MAEKLIKYGTAPICPRCGWDCFDDWWHVLRDRTHLGLHPGGKLVCGACEKLFFIEGKPGFVVSSCYGVKAQ